MKKRITALALCAALWLTGCSSMLEREYVSVAPHPLTPAAGDEEGGVWVESYPDLVSTILFQVRRHQESATIRLRNYKDDGGDVEASLERACEEVSRDDPLGAYAVESIEPHVERIVLYYEATVEITYRRTKEQMDAVSTVTGSGAIRSKLRDALAGFVPETALRINYFPADAGEDYISALIQQAYYDTPEAALGMPKAQVSLYPDAGLQRIVEVRFSYPEAPEDLARKSKALVEAADGLMEELRADPVHHTGDRLVEALYDALRAALRPEEDEEEGKPGSTAYAALVEGRADSEGMALAFQLLCDQAGVECTVVRGEREGAPYFWNIVSAAGGHRHVDASLEGGALLTDGALQALTGAVWDTAEYPPCGDDGDLHEDGEIAS